MTDGTADQNKQFVIRHFANFVNDKDLDAVLRNMSADFRDHDGPNGRPVGRDGDRAMMAKMQELIPDLHVEVVDALAEGDKVVVRNIWTGTNRITGQRVAFRGFVMWRLSAGKIVERWATVTPMHELAADALDAEPGWRGAHES